MSDDKAKFLARIRETNHIGDNTPRLVFADWLEENGEAERAEFIRIQCRIFDLVNDPDFDWSECTGVAASWCPNCGDCCCKDREDSMSDDECPLHSHKSNHDRLSLLVGKETRLWQNHWPHLSNLGRHQSIFFDRGLVTTANVPLELWLFCGAKAVRDQPIITARLNDREPILFNTRALWHNADNALRGEKAGTYPSADYLPAWIFDRLTHFRSDESGHLNLIKTYRTRAQADEALKAVESQCLIRWAIKQQEKDE